MNEIAVRAATAAEVTRWESDWVSRHRQARLAIGMSREATDQHLEWAQDLLKRATDDAMLAIETSAGVGFAHCLVFDSNGTRRGSLVDVWVPEEVRGRGIGRAARDAATQWCVEQGAISIGADFFTGDPAADALIRDWPLYAQRMVLTFDRSDSLAGRPDLPPGISVRPLTAGEYSTWQDAQVTGFADQMVTAGADPIEASERSNKSFADLLPQGAGTPANIIRLVCFDDEPIGSVWINEHSQGDWSFIYSVEVDESQRGKGYGTAAVLACELLSWESGDRAIALNVFAFNTIAIRLYEKLGFRVYDVSRRLDLS